jgi:hypothetical protein
MHAAAANWLQRVRGLSKRSGPVTRPVRQSTGCLPGNHRESTFKASIFRTSSLPAGRTPGRTSEAGSGPAADEGMEEKATRKRSAASSRKVLVLIPGTFQTGCSPPLPRDPVFHKIRGYHEPTEVSR